MRDEWNEHIARLRAGGDPMRSRHFAEFYALAVRDGVRFLASFQRSLGDERILDLVHDVLEDVQRIIDAETPRALFWTALRRRAVSWRRRGDALVAEMPPEEARGAALAEDEGARRAFVIDAREALAALPERDQRIMTAVGFGDDREQIARELGVTRANVDQIVSRTRKRFCGGTP